MFNDVPAQVWILIAITAAAYAPAAYVYQHWVHSSSRRDITLPPIDLSWRTSGRLTVNLALLVFLAAVAIAVFTPAADTIARSPVFGPTLVLLLGFFSLSTVARGLQTGTIEPMVRGLNVGYGRAGQPKRFWASLVWNALLGALLVGFGGIWFRDAPTDALNARCRDYDSVETPADRLAACNRLIRDLSPQGSDVANLVAARGAAHYLAGQDNHALRDYDFALARDPDEPSTWYSRGLVNERLGERQQAMLDYTRAIAADRDNYDALLRRGILYLNTGGIDAAIVDFDRVSRGMPKNINARANRGVAYVWKGDLPAARGDLAIVRAAQPRHVVLLHGDALLSQAEGDTAAAIRHLGAALQVDPNDRFALERRAAIYTRLGRTSQARADLTRLTALERAETIRQYPID